MPSHHSAASGGFSGGHGGGIGFSGGRGGVSSGSSMSSGGRRMPRGPRPYHFFGRTIILTSGGQAGFTFLILFIIFMAIATFGTTAGYLGVKDELHDEREHYEELIEESNMYKDMISNYYSTSGEKYVDAVWATYTNRYYGSYNLYEDDFIETHTGVYLYDEVTYNGNSLPYYFITYKYQVGNRSYYGETYASFTFTPAELRNMNGESESQFQVVYKLNDREESINLSYYTPDGVGDGEKLSQTNAELIKSRVYISRAESTVSNHVTTLIIIVVIDVVLVASLIISITLVVKKSKKLQAEEEEEKQQQAEDREEAKKQRYCAYCGARVGDEENKCPNCGSTKIERK